MASIECDGGHPVLNDLLLHFLKGAKMEQKQPLSISNAMILMRRSSLPRPFGSATSGAISWEF
jgi:hypothetical protein